MLGEKSHYRHARFVLKDHVCRRPMSAVTLSKIFFADEPRYF